MPSEHPRGSETVAVFTITLTRQQLYELYYEGPEATIHFIDGLVEELADQEQILGQRQQRIIDAQHERNERQAAQLKRVKEELERQQCLNYQLTRHISKSYRPSWKCTR